MHGRGDEPLRVSRDERHELVAYLAGEGLSTRAIAPIVGVHRDTVAEDIRTGGGNPPAEPVAAQSESVKVTGLDGKDYTRPAAAPVQRRASLTEESRNAGYLHDVVGAH